MVAAALLVLLCAKSAAAQGVAVSDRPAASATTPQLVPPQLLEATEATYPEPARRERRAGRVLLQLVIDGSGQVTEVTVLEPAGYGFDEAARAAALRFRFLPARRDGAPVTARIRYPFVFELPADVTPQPPSSPGGPNQVASAKAPRPGVADSAQAPVQPAAHVAKQAIDVTVQGAQNEGQRLRESAEAVSVVDTHKAQRETVDMGEVLARTQGVAVRRNGGLGSSARFSLNGLYDDQIRCFLDGVPLDLAGYPFGIVNVPVNLVERIEVYRGVVPIRFGADALGGAVNLVSDQSYRTHLAGSYQVGSFGVQRLTLNARYHHQPTGLVAGGAAFLDLAKNDYPVDIEVPDARGRLSPATVPRFHDGYRAYAATLELGVVERPWARRLLVQGFFSSYDKELQHNVVMTVPYGEVNYGETVYGTTARYAVALRSNVELDLVGNYAQRTIDYVDEGQWVYDWFGRRVRERRVAGEIESRPHNQSIWQNSAFGRALLTWTFLPEHSARVSLTPTFTTRTGDERRQADVSARDPLSAERELLTFVSGVEYELSALDERLSNIVFVKDYVYRANSEEPLPGGVFRQRETASHSQGIGDSLRFRFTPWLYAKASYEFATRLPRPDEVFGNGVLVYANLELEPEVSHNGNVGPHFELAHTPVGAISLDVNAFLRDSDRLIVLLGNDRFFTYQNVYKARGLGLENAVNWSSPGRYVSVDGTLTWQEVRNASSAGTFGDFAGDRIPNRPYLFGSWGLRLRFSGVPSGRDTLEPFYNGRYVHEFFRGWESQGLRQFKQSVDAQVTHHLGISWAVNRDTARVTSTFEVDNLTAAKVFDNFGVQRPGRAFFVKLSAEH